MSLLNRIRASRHLDDDAFAAIWSESASTGQRAGHAHLAVCAQCRVRYAAFESWLEDLRDDARAEADDAFAPERLAAQQAQILRRLEGIERPARIIPFPRFARPVTSTQGNGQRWIAAAAAAGLVIGLAAGQFVDIRDTLARRAPQQQPQIQARANNTPVATPQAPAAITPASMDEELVLGPDPSPSYVRISTLQSIGSITPRVRDIDVDGLR